MATPSRRKSSSVSDRLFAEPYRFGFFQATRLLQGLVRKWRMRGKYNPVGRDVSADDESLKFSSLLSLQFASSEVAKIQKHKRII
ncbi:MAG TPA: type VI secretion system baseplate subunit TssG, partial [Gammaproteobacteria bacterium]|nr:type VI secretion system baseplate subunit TssG [Gammaproteobacteria bacterium]